MSQCENSLNTYFIYLAILPYTSFFSLLFPGLICQNYLPGEKRWKSSSLANYPSPNWDIMSNSQIKKSSTCKTHRQVLCQNTLINRYKRYHRTVNTQAYVVVQQCIIITFCGNISLSQIVQQSHDISASTSSSAGLRKLCESFSWPF